MGYYSFYESPIGCLVLLGDSVSLTGLCLKDDWTVDDGLFKNETLPAFVSACKWLDDYFNGRRPDCFPPISFDGSSSFQRLVYSLTMKIPYGITTTYGALAKEIEIKTGSRTSPRSVGQALHKNPILLIVPCHRVVGADGGLVGYAAGLERKRFLLETEREKGSC